MGISKFDNVIDSREVIERIEELENERANLVEEHQGAEAEAAADPDSGDLTNAVEITLDALQAWDADYGDELKELQDLAEEASGYAADWRHGETLINDSYFETYAQELAEDCGMVKDDATWPNNCIDWAKAAELLQQDYTPVSFGGEDFWIR